MRLLAVLPALFLSFAASPLWAQHLGARRQWQPEIADLDSRLQQRVEIEILGRAAVPALELLSDATGVSLTVAPEDLTTVGERKLTVISKNLTLEAIMVQLPEALQECHWDIDRRDEPVYLLHRNGGAEDIAERAEEQLRAGSEARRRQQRLDSIEDARRALAMSPEELKELEKTDLFLARAAQYPLTRELMEGYASLPDRYVSELVETGRLGFPYGEAPPVIRRMTDAAMELERRYLRWAQAQDTPYAEELAENREQLDRLVDQIAAASTSGVTISIRDFGGREVGFGALLYLESESVNGGMMIVPTRYTRMTSPGSPYEWLLVETGDTVEDARTAVQHSRDEWVRLRDERQWDDSDWIEPSDPRLHQQISIPIHGTEEEGNQYVSILELQKLVAAETGLSIISDFFTGDAAGVYPGQPPLGDLLWRDLYNLGRTGQLDWRLAGDSLVFHHTNWVWLAQRELPESLLLSYRQRLGRQGRFTLDDVTDFERELEAWRRPPPRGFFAIPRDLNVAGLGQGHGYGVTSPLLLYDSLTPDEQARARSPGGLALAELFAEGRRDILRYVPLRGRDRDGSARRELARTATFSLTESEVEARGESYTEYVFAFTFPEDADVPEDVVRTTVRLPETARTETTSESEATP